MRLAIRQWRRARARALQAAASGPVDIVARIMSQWLSEHFRQSFVVENRAGSGGAIAAAPFGGEGGRGMPKNIENNPMQSNRESLAGMLLTDPAKTFDMSGETGAVLNPHAICKNFNRPASQRAF